MRLRHERDLSSGRGAASLPDALERKYPRAPWALGWQWLFPASIKGNEYVPLVGGYYSSLRSLDFKWEKWEAHPICEHAVVFTGWVNAPAVDLKGQPDPERSLFTMVFVRDADNWKRVFAHKTVLTQP